MGYTANTQCRILPLCRVVIAYPFAHMNDPLPQRILDTGCYVIGFIMKCKETFRVAEKLLRMKIGETDS